MTKMAIIGAGLSGLSVAHLLKNYAQVTLFEKSGGVSGRMSTRRAESCSFDHGAQYFTARTKPFQDFIKPLIRKNIIQKWGTRHVKFDGNKIIARTRWVDEEPRYVGAPGMNVVAKHLAEGLGIHVNTKIVSLHRERKWRLTSDKGRHYQGLLQAGSKLV